MQTMTAIVLTDSEAHTPCLAHIPIPRIEPDEMRVRIKALGVGIHDSYFLPSQRTSPFPIGIEAAGVVEEAGSAVSGYHNGDPIAFVSMMQPKGGVWAEYAIVRADSLILGIPESMSFEQAAALPVASTTALRALHALPHLDAGGSMFIAGASGAVGTLAVQLARQHGWDVAASASRANHGYLTDLGANLVVDYTDPHWPEQVLQWRVDGVDGAIAIQPSTTTDSMSVVRTSGTVVTVSGDSAESARGINITGLAYDVDVRDELHTLIDDVIAGDIKLVIEQVYPFNDALEALAKVQTRHARGKTVVTLD